MQSLVQWLNAERFLGGRCCSSKILNNTRHVTCHFEAHAKTRKVEYRKTAYDVPIQIVAEYQSKYFSNFLTIKNPIEY